MLINIISFVIFIHTNAAFGAVKLDWSFADHPHPDETNLTAEERTATFLSIGWRGKPTDFCPNVISVQFEIYNDRYPGFAEIGTEEERFKAWKIHIVEGTYDKSLDCIVGEPFMKILDVRREVELVFCGVFSRQPISQSEKAFVNLVVEMLDYMKLGIGSVIGDLIILHKPDDPYVRVNLNPDVEYLFRKSLKLMDIYEGHFNTDHLEPHLTKQRMDFIDAAVQNRDFDAVLDTTPPCKDRSPVKD